MSKIRGIFTFIQFVITVSITIILMYLFNKHHHKIRKVWTGLQIKLLGIKLEVQGQIDDSCDMVIMNHQALLDIVVMEHLHPRNLAWVGKKEISDLFFFGHIMKAPQMITINREDKTGIVTLLKEGKNRLDNNRPIAMFPEGTRSDGKRMSHFKSGARILADKYNLKVQPAVLLHTKEVLDSKTLVAKPGIVKVIFLPAIQASKNSDWFVEAENQMKEVFYKELQA
ncbi:MAG: 1-acyl-sn-glycerol-3-phosphate acyltransferase [Deltaproteobacteria bacterium HGW-Deltaproteobacteria-24]|nr:MAG: 1-acyl-sn-glycerol-3-phosphate acyltransferase [Deltaproteobacteria bacterium HGW-Deltaproteobacteria-24]